VKRREQVFWGWGEPGAGPSLPDHAAGFLREVLGVSGDVVSPPPRELPAVPPSRLPRSLHRLPGLRDDDAIRVLRAAGKSYLDLLAMRSGAVDAPDAVVAPASHEEVLAVLRACTQENVAVVPFGGGTSVVGGLAPLRDGHRAVISLDLGAMEAVAVDERSLVARIGPGLRLPECERALAARGLTLGHFPQSFEWASVGGCVATRSSGQASTGYGRIDANLVAVRMATPTGDWATLDAPGSAAGPRLRDLVVGSEGTLGVITEAALRVQRVREDRRYEGWFFKSFEEGWEALRALVQAGLAPAVARLSDEAETAMSMALSGGHGLKAKVGPALLRARGYAGGCVLICGWEGAVVPEAGPCLRSAGGMPVGTSPGRSWLASRYAGPHLRDDLLDRGVMVETLETATSWANLRNLYATVRAALAPAHVVCHVSHLYPSGASLYFTAFAAQDRDDPAGQWQRLKDAACRAIVSAGGTITHHHAVGRDHAAYVEAEHGALGVEVLRAVKDRVDPAGIMNPGKLLPR
jgi:alkyldihydroxyacetonephosphate synthase